MKKMLLTTLILAILPAYTIVQGYHAKDEIKITVTADKKTTFDMFDNINGIVKGLKTPYEIKYTRTNSRFIFKALKGRADLKIKVEVNNQMAATAELPVVVVVVNDRSIETFGM